MRISPFSLRRFASPHCSTLSPGANPLQYTPEVGIERGIPIRGTVIARKNKNLDTSFRIINAVDEDIYEAQYPYNSPLLKGVKILQKQRVTEGNGAPRRAKLYFLQVRVDAHLQSRDVVTTVVVWMRALCYLATDVNEFRLCTSV